MTKQKQVVAEDGNVKESFSDVCVGDLIVLYNNYSAFSILSIQLCKKKKNKNKKQKTVLFSFRKLAVSNLAGLGAMLSKFFLF